MRDLIRRLVALESDVRYQERPSISEQEIGYRGGHVPIVLSAPYAAVHTRQGRLKEEEEYTAGVAQLVAELTGAHALYARRKSQTDPNWYRGVPYKRQLRQIVTEAGIHLVLDLHGAAASWDFAVALGTLEGESCPGCRETVIGALQDHGFSHDRPSLDRVDVDDAFTARGVDDQETITRYAWESLRVPSIQVEIHPELRIVERREDATLPPPFRGDPDRIRRLVQALVEIVLTPEERSSTPDGPSR